jgi:hypothetical protein
MPLSVSEESPIEKFASYYQKTNELLSITTGDELSEQQKKPKQTILEIVKKILNVRYFVYNFILYISINNQILGRVIE